MTTNLNQLGQLFRQARERSKLSRDELARRIGLDASYIYRLETGARRPSSDVVLVLAETFGLKSDELNQWLVTAGYAPQPLLTVVRGGVRARGRQRNLSRRKEDEFDASTHWEPARWAGWLDDLGLQEGMIRRLLRTMETARITERQKICRSISTAIIRAAEALESPVRTAVIPAAGGQHRFITAHVMQRLLLGATGEAIESGISNVILILAPEMTETIYAPMKEALGLAIAPAISLQYCEQVSPEGLGAAILQAQALVGESAFAILLPDDVVSDRLGRTAQPRELRRMIEAHKQLDAGAHLVAVTSVPKSRMLQGGIAKLGAKRGASNVYSIRKLIEKPAPNDPIYRARQAYGIVGRYIVNHSIFGPLQELGRKGHRPVQLTDALETLRKGGEQAYAFEMTATRQDVGEVLDQASELFGIVLNQRSKSESV